MTTYAPRPIVGVHQMGFENATNEDEISLRTHQMLARSLNIGRVVGFVGSGISRAYGHPTWIDFAREIAQYTLGAGNVIVEPMTQSLLRAFLEDSGRDAPLSTPDRTLLAMEACAETFARARRSPDFRSKLASYVRQESSGPISDSDPLRVVMETLRIKRFLTINYDLEIERAFVRILKCLPAMVGLDTENNPIDRDVPRSTSEREPPPRVSPEACALTLDPEHPELLLQFAIATPGSEAGVFHCHGIATRPESMVVTESDYQRVYLQDDPIHRAYREALNLAFSSNSILFLGVGMEEPDLLRPLRQFVSEKQRDPRERPLFALLPQPQDKPLHAIELRRFLYSRYGVKALFYPVESDDLTRSLCKAIGKLAEGWTDWWMGWQEKPAPRTPSFSQPSAQVMVHHYTLPRHPIDDSRDELKVANLVDEGSAAVIVLGGAGTGKGTLGLKLATGEIRLKKSFGKRFFATMHFTNELLSTLDAAVRFFDPPSNHPGGILSRLRSILIAERHLLVVGGVERLLIPARPNQVASAEEVPTGGHPLEFGRPVTREVGRFFEIVNEVAQVGLSQIVLTSSIQPILDSKDHLRMIRLDGIPVASLLRHGPFLELGNERLVRQLHQTLHGHAYALAVVANALKRLPPSDRQPKLARLVARMTALDLSRRGRTAVEWAISVAAATSDVGEGIQQAVLQRFALFSTPVSAEAVAATNPELKSELSAVERAVRELVDAELLMQVGVPGSLSRCRYTAHTVVRQHVIQLLGNPVGEIPGETHRSGLSAFSVATEIPPPSTPAGHQVVASAVDGLLDTLEEDTADTAKQMRDLTRAAFGLIRSRWTAGTIPQQAHIHEVNSTGFRLPAYDAYHRRLLRLVNAIRQRQSPAPWLYEEGENPRIDDSDAILYADELGWLYNELGMVSYCQGSAHDAYALFRLSQDMNHVAEQGSRGPRWCQSELNLAGIHLERAHLTRARYHLDNALQGAIAIHDEEMAARVRGFFGLLHHLLGHYHEADSFYSTAIKRLRKQDNRRGLSIFLRHRGDLRRRMGKLDEARSDIDASIVAAESGGHSDLLQYSRVAEANLRLDRGDGTAHEILMPAIEFARRVGIPKLEADALKVQGHIALAHGETELAGRLAVSCLSIAAAFGMRLRLTAGLVFMGRVADARGNRDAAAEIFSSAIDMGQRQGYQLKVEEADRQLMRIKATSTPLRDIASA